MGGDEFAVLLPSMGDRDGRHRRSPTRIGRRPRRAVRPGRQGGLHRRQPGHRLRRGFARRHRQHRPRGAAAQRRRRDVHGEEPRQAALRGVRGRHAQAPCSTACSSRPTCSAPSTTTSSSCTSSRSSRRRTELHDRGRGAGPVAQHGAGRGRARRVHPPVRGDRPDPAPRPMGARRRPRPGQALVVRRTVADDERQPVGDAVAAARVPGRRGRRARRRRSSRPRC